MQVVYSEAASGWHPINGCTNMKHLACSYLHVYFTHQWNIQLQLDVGCNISRSTVVLLSVKDGAGSKWPPVHIKEQPPEKQTRQVQKAYRLHHFAILLTFFESEKPNVKISILFIFFCFYTVCANIMHTKLLLYYRATTFPSLGRCSRYCWRAMASKLSPKMHCVCVRTLLSTFRA